MYLRSRVQEAANRGWCETVTPWPNFRPTAVATGPPIVRCGFDMPKTQRSQGWNVECLCIYSSCHSKHFRLPDGSGDSDLAFHLCAVNRARKFDTERVRVPYRRADVKRQSEPLAPWTQSQPAPGSLPPSVCLQRWRDSQVQRVWPKREEKLKSEHVLTKTAEGYGPLKERLARKQNSQPVLPFHLKCETHGPLWKHTSFKGKALCVKD